MIKYFAGHTEISFSKTMRATYDHQGLSESRVASHNSHFGMRDYNKKDINIFPFKFMSMGSTLAPSPGCMHFSQPRDRCAVAALASPLIACARHAAHAPPKSPRSLRLRSTGIISKHKVEVE